MSKDYDTRVVHEAIISKLGDPNTKQEIRLSQLDFWNSEMGIPTIILNHVPELIIGLEKETGGRISLLSTKLTETHESVIAPNRIVPDPDCKVSTDYFRVSFDPNEIGKNTGDPYYFYLSRKEGLYRALSGMKDSEYSIQNTERFRILEILTHDFQETRVLAEALNTTPDKLRPQIAGIKQKVEDKFPPVQGSEFIVSDTRTGYKLGDKITIKQVA